MEKYWMVHRLGSSGTTRVYDEFRVAAKEAMRLTRKELTRFIILEAVMTFQPSVDPIALNIQRVGAGPSSEHVKTTGPVGLDDTEPDLPSVPEFCRSGFCTYPECDCEEGWARAVHHAAHLAYGVHEHQYYPGCCPSEPEETEPEPEEREECGCYPDNHTCPSDRPEEPSPFAELDASVLGEDEVDYHTASGSGGPGCSCWWCDPDNHDVENCEFPHCGCKRFLYDLEHDMALEALGPIPKVGCPCGCTDSDEPRQRAEYPSPLGEGEAELRREWMPRPKNDISFTHAGWSIEDFEEALANNLQYRSDLCAELLERRGKPEGRGSGQPEGDHWCPHCGDDLSVERPSAPFVPLNGVNEYVRGCECIACLKMRAAAIHGISLEGIPVGVILGRGEQD